MSIRDYKCLCTVFPQNFYQNESSNTGDCVELVQSGGPFEGMGWPLRTAGGRGQGVLQAQKLGSGGTLPGCPGKGKSPCWDRISRQTSGPLSPPSLSAFYFILLFLGGGAGRVGRILQRPQERRRLAGILTPPEGVSFPGCPVGLNCRDGAPTSSSSRGDHQRESVRRGGWGICAGRVPKKAENSRHRPCRTDLCFSPSLLSFSINNY